MRSIKHIRYLFMKYFVDIQMPQPTLTCDLVVERAPFSLTMLTVLEMN